MKTPLRLAVTLLETVVAMAIIAVMVGLAVPAVQNVRAAAAKSGCQSRLSQLALAVNNYAATHGMLPRGCDYPYLKKAAGLDAQCSISWQTSVLPFLEQQGIWEKAVEANRIDPTGHSPDHQVVRLNWLDLLTCPTEDRRTGGYREDGMWGLASYRGVAGTAHEADDGCFHQNYTVRVTDIRDGTSNTLLIGERPAGPSGKYGAWYAGWGYTTCTRSQLLPVGLNHWSPQGADCPEGLVGFRVGTISNLCDVNHYWSMHSGGANFAMADGSAHFVRYGGDGLLPALATRAGGEVSTTIE